MVGKASYPDPDNPDGNPADDVRISPDGKWAIAQVTNQVYLLAVPRTGDGSVVVDISKSPVPLRKSQKSAAIIWLCRWGERRLRGPKGLRFSACRSIRWSSRLPSRKRMPKSKPNRARNQNPHPRRNLPRLEGDSADKGDDKKKLPKLKPEVIAVNLTFPRHTPSGQVVLRGARVITMKGDEVLENADIVVKDNRIVAVGKSGSVTVPAEAKVIDVAGKTIVPGGLYRYSSALDGNSPGCA